MLVYKTRTAIANEFGVCRKTFRKRLSALQYDLPPGNVSPRWQKYVYLSLHFPDGVRREDYEVVRLPQIVVEGGGITG